MATYLAPLLVPLLADVLHEADHLLQRRWGVEDVAAVVAMVPRGEATPHGGASRHVHDSPHTLGVVDALLKAAGAVDEGEKKVQIPTTRLAHHLPPAPALPPAEPPTVASPPGETPPPAGLPSAPPALPPPRA